MSTATPRLKLRLSAPAERALRGGHPWIYADSIREQNREGATGELAVIYSRDGDRFLGAGFYDAASPLRVRILQTGKPAAIDTAWWRARLDAALERRRSLFGPDTTGWRVVNGESDGFPAMVLDYYAGVCVLKLYSAVWIPHLAMLREIIGTALAPRALVLRLSRNAAPAFAAAGLTEGILDGSCPDTVVFHEDGLAMEAEVLRGQKTGFYLDQRENRRRLATLARGASVLNAFAFSGGFSLQAARGGATAVTDLDISRHALDAGSRNFALNQSLAPVAACRRHTIQADAFAWLAAAPRTTFDIAVVDPPSLAKREAERPGAIAAYSRLATAAARHVRPGGILLCASCSAHVSADEFLAAVRRALPAARELWTAGHAPDHPAAFPEAAYLKSIALLLGGRRN